MNTQLYDFEDYIDFLLLWIKEKGHGSKSLLAQASGVQTAYLSLILKKKAHFSLEQAIKLKKLLEFNKSDMNFFLLLLQKNKAGIQELKLLFDEQIKEILTQRQNLKERMQNNLELSLESKIKYFSHWQYSAIHTALLNEKWQTVKGLETLFQLATDSVMEVLDFLLELKLIKKENNRYTADNFRIHIPNDSVLINLHHQNWRLQALKSLQNKQANDLHFSSVFSLSQKDAIDFKNKILTVLEDFDKKIKTSEDEVLFSLGIDWFQF